MSMSMHAKMSVLPVWCGVGGIRQYLVCHVGRQLIVMWIAVGDSPSSMGYLDTVVKMLGMRVAMLTG